MKNKYRVCAGEGEILHIAKECKTLRGARIIAKKESCNGDRHAVIEVYIPETETTYSRWERVDRIS